MADFKSAFNLTIGHEGNYVNDPDDSGGETYKGISRRNFQDWIGWQMVDAMKTYPGFPDCLNSNISIQSEVEKFYEVQFWNRMSGSLISDQSVAYSIFDFAVNSGLQTSVKLAQKVVKSDVDGVVGKNTINAINKFNPDHFINSFAVQKIKRYIEICEKFPKNRKYIFGWIKRSVTF